MCVLRYVLSSRPSLRASMFRCAGVVRLDGGKEDRTCSLVVLDGLVGEAERAELLDTVSESGWDHSKGPPPSKWEKATADGPDLPVTFGLKQEVCCPIFSVTVCHC